MKFIAPKKLFALFKQTPIPTDAMQQVVDWLVSLNAGVGDIALVPDPLGGDEPVEARVISIEDASQLGMLDGYRPEGATLH